MNCSTIQFCYKNYVIVVFRSDNIDAATFRGMIVALEPEDTRCRYCFECLSTNLLLFIQFWLRIWTIVRHEQCPSC